MIIAGGAAVLTAAMALISAGTATAAEYDHAAAIDPSSITVTTVDGGATVAENEQVRVDAEWSVPDGAVAGQTFGFTLPSPFGRAGADFAVSAVGDPSTAVAECVVSSGAAPVVTCTLTDYVNGRTGVGGSLWFTANVDEQTDETTVEFVVGGSITLVDIPGGRIGPWGPLPTTPQKWSWQMDDGNIAWQLALPGASFEGAESIVVDDVLTAESDEYAAHRNEDRRLLVWSTDVRNQDTQPVPGWTGSWNAEGTAFHLTIPGPVDPARVYFVKYSTVPSTQAEGTSYSNVADVNGIAIRDRQVWRLTGGGVGDGDVPGGFTLTNVVVGDRAADVPEDAVFTVRYRFGDPTIERTVKIAAGETASRVELPADTVVTLVEVTPPVIDGIEWGTPVFSGEAVGALTDGGAQFTVPGGATLPVTLTNTATAKPAVEPGVTPPNPPAEVVPPVELPLTGETSTTEQPMAEQPQLAATGGDVPAGYLWGGGAALLLGIALTVLASARARKRRAQD